MKKRNIRSKIKEIAKEALIDPTEAFFERVEEELEKQVNIDFLERIRQDMLRKPGRGRPSKQAGGNAHCLTEEQTPDENTHNPKI
jgi:hypothetical protein